jgi:uncharacterized protein (TIGR00251 family)
VDIDVKVIPRASRSEIAGKMADGALKVKVAAPPEKGRANAAVRELLARHYGVPASRVRIVSGAASSRKRVRVEI